MCGTTCSPLGILSLVYWTVKCDLIQKWSFLSVSESQISGKELTGPVWLASKYWSILLMLVVRKRVFRKEKDLAKKTKTTAGLTLLVVTTFYRMGGHFLYLTPWSPWPHHTWRPRSLHIPLVNLKDRRKLFASLKEKGWLSRTSESYPPCKWCHAGYY